MATRTWDNGGGDGLWSNAANWSNNTKPVAGDSVVFDATSTANCTIDEAINVADFSVSAGYTYSAGVSGTITSNAGLTHAITGNLNRSSDGKIVFGSTSTWNIAGNFGAGANNRDDFGGATVNLSGSGKTLGTISCAGASRGTVNLLLGASYDQDNGEIGGVDFHCYGTITSSAELNIGRNTSKITRVYNHSTGVFSGAGTIIFTGSSQWLLQDGSVQIDMGIIKPTSNMILVPGDYRGGNNSRLFQIYRQGADAHQIFYWSAGTYDFGRMVALDDGFTGIDTTLDNSAGATINVHGNAFELNTLSDGWLWTPGVGGKIVFSASASLNSNGQTLDEIDATAGTLTLAANLACTALVVSGGTLAAASKTLTIRDHFGWTGGTLTGVAGTTWTVNGSVYWSGITANPASDWTIATIALPGIYTANAVGCTISHVVVTGLTMQASTSTDSGNNSGITFSNTARLATEVLDSYPVTLSTAVHAVEGDVSGAVLTVRLDAVTQFSTTLDSNLTATSFGLVGYFDGSYTVTSLDYFDSPLNGVPPAPRNFAVSGAAVGTWGTATGATAYYFEQAVSGSGSYSVVDSGQILTASATTSLGTTYDYRVRASNANGYGPYSDVVTVAASTLAGYWTMGDGAAIGTDSTPNAHHLTASGTVSTVAGKQGNAADFDRASSERLSVANHSHFNIATDFSVGCWYKQKAGEADFQVWCAFGKGDPFASGAARGFWLGAEDAARSLKLRVAPADGGSQQTHNHGAISNATWYHLVVTWNATTKDMKLYVNGALSGTLNISAGLANNASPVTFGSVATTNYTDGTVDEGFWYARLLSLAEVQQLYNGGTGTTYPPPVS